MFEKVNPAHPDKIADRIAGAIVDLAYRKEENPRIAVEVLIGHGTCTVMIETGTDMAVYEIEDIVRRIAGNGMRTQIIAAPQDEHLAKNQENIIRCGDNGIFKGAPVTAEQKKLAQIAKEIYAEYPSDGKYLIDGDRLTICQSMAETEKIKKEYPGATVNPLGDWTGGTDTDAGATNRKLGSDMGDGVTGGGLHGKDLSKADVTINIYAWLKAQETGETVEFSCSIGDEYVDGLPYEAIVKEAREYIESIGGFEKFAEWGLVR